jgi:hypothetical protein
MTSTRKETLITFVRFDNGLEFELGSVDSKDQGIIIGIVEHKNGYEIMGYEDEEGYSRYYTLEGENMEEDDIEFDYK